MDRLIVIGGGLAGCEAAWQAAERGIAVTLYEMRPSKMTPAHQSDQLAELVCSNSLGSMLRDRAPGLLKAELSTLNSLILSCAQESAVPAGRALAVGRETFSQLVTERVEAHPLISVVREHIGRVPRDGVVIVATGPLTSDELAVDIASLVGQESLAFYDAMAPIVSVDSIDMSIAFRASRWDDGPGDYINCPMDKDQYETFVAALTTAERIPLESFETQDKKFFEACLPVEVLAVRGIQALAFGPLRPVGLFDPRTGRRPYAAVQLRQDNVAGSLYNLVGFQTNLRWPEQKRVFGMIPGLENAEWVRYGQMHRNTFLCSPSLLEPTCQWRGNPSIFFAGQLIGTEGYVGSAASGLLAGINAARFLRGQSLLVLPETTMLGSLMHYVSAERGDSFQPIKANMGLLPPMVPYIRKEQERRDAMVDRAEQDLHTFIEQESVL